MLPFVVALLYLQTGDPVAEGSKALDEGKYAQAVQAFTRAVAADPKDYYSHFSLALAYTFLKKDDEALAEYRRTLELKPQLYEAELNAAILLMRRKEPADALPLLEDAVRQKDKEFQPRYYLAEAELATGAFVKAETDFRTAIELNPKSAASAMGLAQALARLGKMADAEPHYRKAIELDPRYRDSLLELAQLYEAGGQTAQAIAIYREFPDNAAAQERLGKLMLDNKQFADAIPTLEAAYAKDPNQSNRTALAAALVFAGKLEKATPLLEQSVSAEPGNYDLRLMYARALRDRKQFSPAAVQFYEAAKLKPREVRPWTELGGMLYMMGDYPKALAAFDHARDLGENTSGTWFLRAIILDKLRQVKPALEAYQKFLALDEGKNPTQNFQARQRSRILQRELEKR